MKSNSIWWWDSILKVWGMWSTRSLSLLPGPLWPGIIVPVMESHLFNLLFGIIIICYLKQDNWMKVVRIRQEYSINRIIKVRLQYLKPFNIPQIFSFTGTSPSDYLVPYPGNSLEESYPSTQIQAVYSATPTDRANITNLHFCYIAMNNNTYTYACRNIFNKTSGHSSLEKIYPSLDWKGCVWEGVGDRTKTAIY